MLISISGLFFFFQAEDGIRDHCVTGVQTCALPILPAERRRRVARRGPALAIRLVPALRRAALLRPWRRGRICARAQAGSRSEERRVGKECRARGAAAQLKKKCERTAYWVVERVCSG